MHRKFFLVASLLILLAACSDNNEAVRETQRDRQDSVQFFGNTVDYANAQYDISLTFPEAWIILEQQNLEVGEYAINLFKENEGAEENIPLGAHESSDLSYIAIWPQGLGTELPYSQKTNLKDVMHSPALNFAVNREESKLLLLQDSTIWGYFLVPESWSDYGFIYAQIEVNNGNVICKDAQTGEQKPTKNCNVLDGGDEVIRTGDVNEEDAAVIRNVLESISLKPTDEKVRAGDLIEVEQPLTNTTVTSPLTVSGQAKGFWYFEGNFSIELVDAEGNTLAEVPVQAMGKWMTEDFVPFEVTIEFESPGDERGKLIFHRPNPSGLEKHDMAYTVPVVFS